MIRPARLTAAVFLAWLFLFASRVWAEVPLVEIKDLDSTIVLDIKYATADNFMKEILYPDARAFLQPRVAERLVRVQERLRAQGLGLKVFDGYRPLSVQKKMFARFPQPGFVADPAKGSNHNRGAAVDVGLVDATGHELPMPSRYDEFSERSHIRYAGGTAEELKNRGILQDAMKAEGFKPLETEWWHFDDPDWQQYPILDIPIEDL